MDLRVFSLDKELLTVCETSSANSLVVIIFTSLRFQYTTGVMREQGRKGRSARMSRKRPGSAGPPWWLSLCFSIPAIILSVISLLGR